ncbi:MAG TPA: VWA domain-containing protein, partial [Thermodesulfobacteriota bacterium]|nr:VWA domain-containing protein [Thermodesulfobacteriota bacterium]
ILLTDGEDNSSSIPPLQAAKLAKEYGIRIYTIGIGSNGPVPYPDQYGRIVMAEIKLDEKLLREIADTTGGSYYRATDSNALEKVYAQINKLEKSKSEKRQYLIRTPLYRYPLGAGLGLLALIALAPLLSEEVRKRQYGV